MPAQLPVLGPCHSTARHEKLDALAMHTAWHARRDSNWPALKLPDPGTHGWWGSLHVPVETDWVSMQFTQLLPALTSPACWPAEVGPDGSIRDSVGDSSKLKSTEALVARGEEGDGAGDNAKPSATRSAPRPNKTPSA